MTKADFTDLDFLMRWKESEKRRKAAHARQEEEAKQALLFLGEGHPALDGELE